MGKMSELDKGLELAMLMGWKIEIDDEGIAYTDTTLLQPYVDSETGKAQFATILLKYPEVMRDWPLPGAGHYADILNTPMTQGNILDKVLKMKGFEI